MMAESTDSPASTYIVGVDVGSTTICCYVFDEFCREQGQALQTIVVEHPRPGYTEIDPENLWKQFQEVVNEAFKSANISAKDVTALGLATQRGSFVTWDRETGIPLHNFIGWQDLRATKISDEWNSSLTFRGLKFVSKIMYGLTGNDRYKAASIIKFSPALACMRLCWLLQNNPIAREKANNGTLMFGTIDSWLIWKLSGGQCHVTDYGNASSTGIFDTFQMEWSSLFCKIFDLPMSLFPETIDSSGFIVDAEKNIFGSSFPITGLAADQQASVFGQCCFERGDINCTIGTGTFIDINTGNKPHASYGGLYPLVGWKIGEEIIYIAEGHNCGTSAAIEWSRNIGLFDDVAETSDMAYSVPDADGVCFVPGFDGLQVPNEDNHACALLIGIKKNSTKQHIIRAVLESIAFRFYQIYQIAMDEIRVPVTSSIKADGGVTNNDFVVELIASMTEHVTDRSTFSDMGAVGAAYFAGLGIGVWKSKEDLKGFRDSRASFQPKPEIRKKYTSVYTVWKQAVQRSLNWYKEF